jgi:hypothetical protein
LANIEFINIWLITEAQIQEFETDPFKHINISFVSSHTLNRRNHYYYYTYTKDMYIHDVDFEKLIVITDK